MSKTDKICIIGAGPGGLSAAMALKEAGYNNVTVYEKSNRVGGQVCSKTYVTPEGKEMIYEQCAAQPMGSRHLNKFIKKYDVHYVEKKLVLPYSLVERKVIFTPSPKTILNPRFLADIAKLTYFLFKYRCLWKPGFSNLQHVDELAMPFNDWVDKHFHSDVNMLLRLIVQGLMSFQMTATYKVMPTCYGFKLLMYMLRPPMRYINQVLKQVKEGYQEIWNRVAKDLNVELNTKINNVERTETAVMVNVNGENIHFDKLIIACQEYAEFLDCTENEKFIGESPKKEGALTVTFVAKNGSLDSPMIFTDYLNDKRQTAMGGIIPNPRNPFGDNQGLYTAYYMFSLEEEKPEVIKENIMRETQKTLSYFGAELEKIIHIHKEPYYGFYFSEQEIRDGILERSEARQGVKNTYFVGERLSSGTNAPIVDYAYDLVKKHF